MSVRVATRGDREIVMTRDFRAPDRLVFAAYTEPDLLRRWYGARGWSLAECRVDLRVGGRWRFVSHGPGGATMGQSGEYRQIEPHHRLVLTELFDDQSYPGESVITHQFLERDGRTTVTTTVRFATPEGRDIVLRYPMARGAGEGADRLDLLLAELTATSDPTHEGDLT